MQRLLKEPLLHFLLFGALLFGAYAWLNRGTDEARPTRQVRVGERAFTLSRGDFFGEMALLLQQRRQADVSTVTYCQLLVLDDDDFQDLLRRTPSLKKEIDRIAAERSEMNERMLLG